MAGSGEDTIRGLKIDKIAKGFADEENKFKRVCTINKTGARNIRFYRKTSGFLAATTTTGYTADMIVNSPERAQPPVVEQTWTRATAFVQKFFVESPLISMEDIKDTDIQILATNIRDLTRAVARKVDKQIYDVITTDNGQTTASTAVWGGGSEKIVSDLMTGKRKIRQQGYDPEGAWLLLSPTDHAAMMTSFIETNGASIPIFSSDHMKDGMVMQLLGLKVIVSENVDADEAAIVVGQRAMTWHAFTPLTAAVIDDPGIGKKIRIWEEGRAVMTDTNAVHITTNTQ